MLICVEAGGVEPLVGRPVVREPRVGLGERGARMACRALGPPDEDQQSVGRLLSIECREANRRALPPRSPKASPSTRRAGLPDRAACPHPPRVCRDRRRRSRPRAPRGPTSSPRPGYRREARSLHWRRSSRCTCTCAGAARRGRGCRSGRRPCTEAGDPCWGGLQGSRVRSSRAV